MSAGATDGFGPNEAMDGIEDNSEPDSDGGEPDVDEREAQSESLISIEYLDQT